MKNIICVTTYKYKKNDSISELRTKVFLDTLKQLSKHDIKLSVLCDVDTPKKIIKKLISSNVEIYPQKSKKSMGSIRREALKKSKRYEYICWIEPEKPDIIRFIPTLLQCMQKNNSVLGLFNRTDMNSYPPEQACYYLFCCYVASSLLGYDLDYGFGPMIMHKSIINYFAEYKSEYGDLWDSILVPRLRIIKNKLPISLLSIDFKNDIRMTNIEKGNIEIIKKRVLQLENVVNSMINDLS